MNKNLKIGIVFLVVIILAVVLVNTISVNKTGNLTLKQNVIKVGVLADLSGPYADVLKGADKGAELAVSDLQAQGYNIKLITGDQMSCDSKETVKIVNKFLNIDKVNLIIGGTCSNTTLAAAPMVENAKTIMISPVSSAPSITTAGDYVFRTYISDNLRTEKISELAYKLGYRKMAIITDTKNDATVQASKAVKEKFTALGGQIVSEQGIVSGNKEFNTAITKIKENNPDVIMISAASPEIAILAKEIKEQNINTQLLVPLETAQAKEVLDTGSAVNNLIYVLPGKPPKTSKYIKFENEYKKKYNVQTVPNYAAESYDAVMLGVKAIIASNKTKEDIKNKLYTVSKTYQGVSGNVTFDKYGDVHKKVIFKQIINGKIVDYNN